MSSTRSASKPKKSVPKVKASDITERLNEKSSSRLGIMLGVSMRQQLRTLDVELTNRDTRKEFEET